MRYLIFVILFMNVLVAQSTFFIDNESYSLLSFRDMKNRSEQHGKQECFNLQREKVMVVPNTFLQKIGNQKGMIGATPAICWQCKGDVTGCCQHCGKCGRHFHNCYYSYLTYQAACPSCKRKDVLCCQHCGKCGAHFHNHFPQSSDTQAGFSPKVISPAHIKNPHYLEVLVSKGYILQYYMWVIQPKWRSTQCIQRVKSSKILGGSSFFLIGYDKKNRYFYAQKNETVVKVSYDYIKKYGWFGYVFIRKTSGSIKRKILGRLELHLLKKYPTILVYKNDLPLQNIWLELSHKVKGFTYKLHKIDRYCVLEIIDVPKSIKKGIFASIYGKVQRGKIHFAQKDKEVLGTWQFTSPPTQPWPPLYQFLSTKKIIGLRYVVVSRYNVSSYSLKLHKAGDFACQLKLNHMTPVTPKESYMFGFVEATYAKDHPKKRKTDIVTLGTWRFIGLNPNPKTLKFFSSYKLLDVWVDYIKRENLKSIDIDTQVNQKTGYVIYRNAIRSNTNIPWWHATGTVKALVEKRGLKNKKKEYASKKPHPKAVEIDLGEWRFTSPLVSPWPPIYTFSSNDKILSVRVLVKKRHNLKTLKIIPHVICNSHCALILDKGIPLKPAPWYAKGVVKAYIIPGEKPGGPFRVAGFWHYHAPPMTPWPPIHSFMTSFPMKSISNRVLYKLNVGKLTLDSRVLAPNLCKIELKYAEPLPTHWFAFGVLVAQSK